MSLTRSHELIAVARTIARELRRKQTRGERIFWEAVRNRRFNRKKFLRQHPIFHGHLGKETFYVADFYCAEAMLIVEIDGKIHEHTKERDRLRSSIMSDLGMKVVRFRNDDVEQNLDRVLMELKKHLRTHPPIPLLFSKEKGE
jgi:very-short-patch-repair endonuclease